MPGCLAGSPATVPVLSTSVSRPRTCSMRVVASLLSLNLSPALEITLFGKVGSTLRITKENEFDPFIHSNVTILIQVSGEMDPSGTKPRDADDRPADGHSLGICHLHSSGH